jgi:hypothetical protein
LSAGLDLTRPGGAARLGAEVFEISEGGRSVSFAYREVELIRLSYRPRSLDYNVYRLDVRMRDGRSVKLFNVANSPLAVFKPYERWDRGYALFVEGLARRVAAAAPKAQLLAGLPNWRFWPAAAVGAMLAGFLTVRGVAAAVDADWRAAIVCALGLLAALAFLKAFLWRNRPQRFAPGAIPAEVLP